MGVNVFADWTPEEFKKMLGDHDYNPEKAKATDVEITEYEDLPVSVNWTAKGAVTPVKNQGQCGSCWAFSATGTLESAYYFRNGHLTTYSEQNLVDCAYGKEWDNFGCNGGLSYNAFQYAQVNPLMTEAAYPYLAKDPTTDKGCQYDESKGVAGVVAIGGMVTVTVTQLKTLLVDKPVSVSVEASGSVFHLYTGGVITSEECGTQLDHAVLAVGYGVTEDGVEYFIVKNSWSEAWGENGYVRIGAKSESEFGICGILTRPVFVVV